jgi:exoribonuclease-2
MELGNIVEFIDRQKILCAVVLEVKAQRLRLLTENSRELSLSAGRLLSRDRQRLDVSIGRSRLVEILKEVAIRRQALVAQVAVRDLWEVLNAEQQWIDLETMTAFCFPNSANGDHRSAVIRALFNDRLFFRFSPDRFFPNSEEQVERLSAQRREEARRQRVIEKGGDWLRRFLARQTGGESEKDGEHARECIDVLKAYYLFDKESPDHLLARGVLDRAGLGGGEDLFPLLVRLGVFSENENIEILRREVPVEFPPEVLEGGGPAEALRAAFQDPRRQDLTPLELMTIDGQSTLDFDDALSLETFSDGCRLGIHIADVAQFVRRGDPLDREALARGSSIYMPDRKIPMLPPVLAEGYCSLKAGELRPAISTLIDFSPELEIRGYRIVPSIVRVRDQLTYFDANLAADQDPRLVLWRRIARKFRDERLAVGAVHISVPEIGVWLGESGEISVNRVNRESPGRMLVTEIMILANALMAKFLVEHRQPAVFRSQPDPRERLYRGEEGSLFQHWMQRRLLNRFVLSHEAGKHSGLGLDAYLTATSPIRKYFDLVCQRQVRAVQGFEEPYRADEIDRVIQLMEIPMANVMKLQASRQRFWLLKFLEQRIGQKEEAIVLVRRRHSYQVLLTEYMLECDLPLTGAPGLKPEDVLQVTIQRVDARRDQIGLVLG